MEQSKAKLDIRELPKGVELNSLSIHVTFIKIIIHIYIIKTQLLCVCLFVCVFVCPDCIKEMEE